MNIPNDLNCNYFLADSIRSQGQDLQSESAGMQKSIPFFLDPRDQNSLYE